MQPDRHMIPAGVSNLQVADKPGELSNALNDSAIITPYAANPLLMTILVWGTPDYTDYERHNAVLANVSRLARDAAAAAFEKSSTFRTAPP